jgi:hypothetical protein
MDRYAPGAGGGTDRARSRRGGPLQQARLGAWDGAHGLCTSRARAEAQAAGTAPRARMTVSRAAFLQRWRRHVPAPQPRLVRASGLSHPTHAEALALCRVQGGQPRVVVPGALEGQTAWAQRGAAPPEPGPAWGQRRVGTESSPRGGAPPLGRPGEHAA